MNEFRRFPSRSLQTPSRLLLLRQNHESPTEDAMARKKKTGWGGVRKPSQGKKLGRPRKFTDAQHIRSILLLDELYEYANEIGGGNASEGIRLALSLHQTMRHQFHSSAPPDESQGESP